MKFLRCDALARGLFCKHLRMLAWLQQEPKIYPSESFPALKCLTDAPASNMTFASSHIAAMRICWLTSGDTLTLLDPNDFAGRPIVELKRFLQTLVGAGTYRQRFFAEDGSVEMKDEDVLDPCTEIIGLVVSNVSLQDIVHFAVAPLPVAFWRNQRANPTVKKAYGQSYAIRLTLGNGRVHQYIATHRMRGPYRSCFFPSEPNRSGLKRSFPS